MALYHGKTTQELSNFIKILKELILWEVFLLIKQRWEKMSFTLIFSQEESGLQQECKGYVWIQATASLLRQPGGHDFRSFICKVLWASFYSLFFFFWRTRVFYERHFPEVYGFLTLEEPRSCIVNRCQDFIPSKSSSRITWNREEGG